MRSLQLQVDAELRKKEDLTEEERIGVQKGWAASRLFALNPPNTWKELAIWLAEGREIDKEKMRGV